MSWPLIRQRPPVPLFTADATVARNPASWAAPPAGALRDRTGARARMCWSIASANRLRRLRQRPPTSARRASRAMADGSRTSLTRQDGMKCTSARLDRAGEAMQMTKTGATEPVWAREGLFYREGERDDAARAQGRKSWRTAGDLRRTFRARSRRKPRVVRRRSSGPVFHHVEECAAAARAEGGEELGDGDTVVPSPVRVPVRGGALKRKRIFVQRRRPDSSAHLERGTGTYLSVFSSIPRARRSERRTLTSTCDGGTSRLGLAYVTRY